MITLQPHERADIPLRVKWLNNRNANTHVTDDPDHVTTITEQEQWFDRYEADSNKEFFTSSSQNASWACPEDECDKHIVSPEGDTLASKNARFRPRNAPSACHGDSEADVFTIYDDGTPIGFIGLSNIDTILKQASIFIMIGEDEYRGKGNGTLALNALLAYGKSELGLTTFTLEVFKENAPAVQLYTNAGFIHTETTPEGMLHMELQCGA